MSRSDAEKLTEWRSIGARRSEQTVELATKVLASGNVGDQATCKEWALREQLAIAALDMGRIKLASHTSKDQIETLHAKFPNSPRVRILDGLRLEADEDVERAKAVYEDLLKEDETNVTAHQRLISLSLPSSSAIPLLLSYLDTFYSDPAAWSVLADLYCEKGLYSQALTVLGHIAIISNWDDGVIRRSGEVAYTMGYFSLHIVSATANGRWLQGLPIGIKVLFASSGDAGRKGHQFKHKPDEDVVGNQTSERLGCTGDERLLAAKGKGIDVRRQMLGEMVSNR
uniref:ER membrane protein complex subunit 2 n=1 Tax=Cryptococcus depauperatus TaxID=5208 RepID=D2JWU2_9TREE|nr:conserved hypothetical protein [Cryptococcus depauperatus]